MGVFTGRGAARLVATVVMALAAGLLIGTGTVQAATPPGEGSHYKEALRRGFAVYRAGAILVAMGPNAAAYPSLVRQTFAGGDSFAAAPLTRSLDRYLAGVPGKVSVSVRDLTTGRSYAYNRGLRTATASIVKVDIVMTLLLQAQREGRALTAAERETARRAIQISDNAATTRLWSAIGGASGLAAANARFGLRETTPGPGGAWGATTTSAADQVRLLTALTSPRSPLTARNRRHVLELMGGVAPEQAWGVSASGRDAALKNGWLPRERHGGRWTVNSIGRVRSGGHTYLIAVISERHGTMDAGVRAVERVSRLVTGALA